jgi:hypothetical protein
MKLKATMIASTARQVPTKRSSRAVSSRSVIAPSFLRAVPLRTAAQVGHKGNDTTSNRSRNHTAQENLLGRSSPVRGSIPPATEASKRDPSRS